MIMKNIEAFNIYSQYLLNNFPNWEGKHVRATKEKIAKIMLEAQTDSFNNSFQLSNDEIKNKLWFWSDHHFFHANIILPTYSDRPFKDVGHMNQMLLKNYASKIKEDDIVVFGGDIAFKEFDLVDNWITTLPGKKIWVVGNHDVNKTKLVNFHWADEVCAVFTFKYNEIEYIVSHYPIHDSLIPKGMINIHGHTHRYDMKDVHLNMCVEKTNYQPEQFLDLIKRKK